MKRLLLLLFIIVFLSLLYTVTLTCETFDIYAQGDEVCVTPDRGRVPIQYEINQMSDILTGIKLKLDRRDDELQSLQEGDQSTQADFDEADRRQEAAHNEARRQTVGAVANSAPPVPGHTQDEVHGMLSDHYSKPVTQDGLDNLNNNANIPNAAERKRQNQASAAHYDNTKANPVEGKKTSDDYMNKNSAKCTCSNNPALGQSILNDAYNYGFVFHGRKHHKHTKAGCPERKDDCGKKENANLYRCKCTRVTAGKYLKTKCTQKGCTPENPMGIFPQSKKKMSKGTGKASTKDHSKPLKFTKKDM